MGGDAGEDVTDAHVSDGHADGTGTDGRADVVRDAPADVVDAAPTDVVDASDVTPGDADDVVVDDVTDAADGAADAGDAASDAGDANDAATDADDAATDAGDGSTPECTAPSDCADPGNECLERTCDAGVCGTRPVAHGTATTAQIMGDCQRVVCDGAGATTTVADDADVPNDGNECTTDSCSGGTRVFTPRAAGTACGATGALFCDASGACVGCVTPANCGTPPACHENTCVAGSCGTRPSTDGTACNDGNACTQADTCQAGMCVGSSPVTCAATDACHDTGTCDPSTGACSNPARANGAACNDGNACTQTDTCQAGVCTGGSPVTCTASDQCHGAGLCNPVTGACTSSPSPDGTPCNDGNACTQADTCQAGVCGGSPVVCTGSDQCHNVGTCDPTTGGCLHLQNPDGTPCNDGNACTQADTCQAGACTGGSPVICTGGDQCHSGGTCDPATGACSGAPNPDGTPCNDGNACTSADTCQAGVCIGGIPMACAPSDQCHGAGTCDPTTGACSNPLRPIDTPCTGGGGAVCSATGACVQCNSATQCPNPNPECAEPTCVANGCGFRFAAVGTMCSAGVCDGSGGCITQPTVVGTTPADGTTGVAVASTIAVTFSAAMDASSFTFATAPGACTGSVQVSTDGFATCIGIGVTNLAGNVLTLTPAPGLSYGSTYNVRVTAAALGAGGTPCQAYTSATGFTTTARTATCSAGVVISQVYGGGGNSGATYRNDFVELHNNGGTTVSIGGWSVQYQAAGGTTWSATAIPAGATIAPGGYYLVQEGPASTTGAPLPTPDATGTINFAVAAGKVALVASSTALSGQCPAASMVDLVQWGTCAQTCFEGTSFAPAPSGNAQSALRGGSGCADTNQNASDFSVGTVTPHNSMTTANSCACTLNESNLVLEADYCMTETTGPLALTAGASSGPIYGQLYESGVTESAGASSWLVQVGYGPASVNPEWESGWTWLPASWDSQAGFSNNNDRYSGSFTAPATGTYRVAYRVSSDGTNWTYCDGNVGDQGAGSNPNLTFEVTRTTVMTTTP